MRALLILLFASLVAFYAAASTFVYKANGNEVRLRVEACANAGILSMLKDEFKVYFQRGEAVVNGKRYELCWIMDPGGVFILFEDGDRAMLPFSSFKEDPGV